MRPGLVEDPEPVPGGPTGKKVKARFRPRLRPGRAGRVYLLKGTRTSSCLSAGRRLVDQLANAPGTKYPAGSWLVYDGDSLVYCHQARSMAWSCYNVRTSAWRAAPGGGLPLVGRSGRSRKAKDGSIGAWLDGMVYALKGGSTTEFYEYRADSARWIQLEDIPEIGSSAGRRRSKPGAVWRPWLTRASSLPSRATRPTSSGGTACRWAMRQRRCKGRA